MKSRNKLHAISITICLSAVMQQLMAADDVNVYMLAQNKITGTTYTQVVFFQSDEIATLEQCEKEREYGLTSGWRIFTHLLKSKKGVGYSTYYSCAQSQQTISNWIGQRSRRDVIYLVENKNNELKIRLMESYAKCVREVRRIQGEESNQLFCGKSTQKIISRGDR